MESIFTKQEELMPYEAPQVEVIEVEVEQGFVASPNGFPLYPDDPLG